jgi:hypothetical protein
VFALCSLAVAVGVGLGAATERHTYGPAPRQWPELPIQALLSFCLAGIAVAFRSTFSARAALNIGVGLLAVAKFLLVFLVLALGEPDFSTVPWRSYGAFVVGEPLLALAFTPLLHGSAADVRTTRAKAANWLVAASVVALVVAPSAWRRLLALGLIACGFALAWWGRPKQGGWRARDGLAFLAATAAGLVVGFTTTALFQAETGDLVPWPVAQQYEHWVRRRLHWNAPGIALWETAPNPENLSDPNGVRHVIGWDRAQSRIVDAGGIFRRLRQQTPMELADKANALMLRRCCIVRRGAEDARLGVRPPRLEGANLVFWTTANGEPDGSNPARHAYPTTRDMLAP